MRKLFVTVGLTAALLAGGTGVASATDNPNRHPDITEHLECGPGNYPGTDYSYCKPERLLQIPKAHNPHANHWWNPWSWFW